MIACRILVLLLCAALVPAAAGAEQAVEVVADIELPFRVIPRSDQFEFFPCNECHEDLEPDATPRELTEAPHFPQLQHGKADIWCTTCHSLDHREYLQTLSGKLVEFDRAYLVCSQCHSRVYEDWQYGGHGKRIKRWRGGREVLNCTGCHDPHQDPGIGPRAPRPPPGVRAGLQRQERLRLHAAPWWERVTSDNPESSDVPH